MEGRVGQVGRSAAVLAVLLLALVTLPSVAASDAGAPPLLDLSPEGPDKLRCARLAPFLQVLPDADGSLTVFDVTSDAFTSDWRPFPDEPIGFAERAVWMRFRLRSDLPQARTWMLFPGYWGVAKLHLPATGGFVTSRSGAFVAVEHRSVPEASLAMYLLALPVAAGPQEMTVYLRAENNLALGRATTASPSLHVELHPGFLRSGRGLVFLQACTMGVLLALGLYHLLLWTRVPERAYLTFGLALLGRGLLSAADSRLLLEFVWPSAPVWDYQFRLFEAPLWFVPFYLFLMTFLDTRHSMPRVHRLLQVMLVASFGEPVLVWLRPHPITQLNGVGWLVLLIVPVLVAALALRRRRREAVIFLSANVVMLTYTLAYVLRQNEVGLPLPWWGASVGEVVAAVLFAVAVAESIRRLRRESEQARRDEARASLALKRRELESTLLAGELSQARLQVLRNQLKPHFLFNTLNSISALMHIDVGKALRMLAMLTELLRSVLAEDSPAEVPLADEIAFSRRYLEIEQTRFPKRLSVVWDIAEDAREVQVPHLLLQPLVENAVRHGIAPRTRPGTLWVKAWREHDRLVVEVRDNGVGPGLPSSPGHGMGLANTRARLRTLYGEAAGLEAGAAAGEGFVVRLWLPVQIVQPPAPGHLAAGEVT